MTPHSDSRAPAGPPRAIAAGMDIGGTAAKVGLWDCAGTPLAERWIDTTASPGPAAVLTQFAGAVAALRAEWPGSVLRGVGIACAGFVDAATGIVEDSPNLPGFRGAPLAALAREAFPGVALAVDNDANACAFAEVTAGAARGARHVLCVTWGTGIGGAVVLEGALWRGGRGAAGEIGHMAIALRDGAPCACGRRGCIESVCSSAALLAAARAAGVTGDGGAPPRTVEELAACAHAGDAAARAILQHAAESLGEAIGGAINLLDIDCCVLGGGIARAGALVFDGVRAGIAARAVTAAGRATPVLEAAWGVSAGWIGAALLACAAAEARSGALRT